MERTDFLSKGLPEVVFCFLDVETTGLDPYLGDRICEIALLKTINKEVVGTFHSLVNPARPISPDAYAVNFISDEMVKDAPLFDAIANQVLEFMRGTVLVAHNAPFDLSFLSVQLRLLNLPRPDNWVIDTLRLARKYYRFPGNDLGTIARCLNIKPERRHRALADVQTTKQIFDVFLNDFQTRGVEQLEMLIKLQGGSCSFS